MRHRVTIQSDGTPQGTRVYVDGVELEGVQSISWDCDPKRSSATIVVRDPIIEVETDAEVLPLRPPTPVRLLPRAGSAPRIDPDDVVREINRAFDRLRRHTPDDDPKAA